MGEVVGGRHLHAHPGGDRIGRCGDGEDEVAGLAEDLVGRRVVDDLHAVEEQDGDGAAPLSRDEVHAAERALAGVVEDLGMLGHRTDVAGRAVRVVPRGGARRRGRQQGEGQEDGGGEQAVHEASSSAPAIGGDRATSNDTARAAAGLERGRPLERWPG
jgi:hypothetical protein